MKTSTLLPVLRVPAVIGLLAAIGWLTDALARQLMRLELDGIWRAWAPVALLGAVTAAVVLAGRQQRHPPAVLVVEAVVAAVLGFMAPVQWIYWFGFGGVSEYLSTVPLGHVQPLAIVWFVTAVGTAWRQRSGDATSPRSPVVGTDDGLASP
ncbi:MAG TPA: hypothetical protein VK906_07960 [Egicoccus sp.]|nr:hypothetical protein [Egicoccus sp.]HSK23093.1 hypothetical protein [Egicoccus sp.]